MKSSYAVGCYTDRPGRETPGRGISLINLDEERGVLSETGLCEGVKNPSYLWFDRASKLMLAATENGQNEGCVTSFILEDGELREQSVIEGPGRSNCHVNACLSSNLVFAASYGDGHCKFYKLEGNKLTETLLDYAYKGAGPDKNRQEHSHAHQTVLSPDNVFLYVVDLGCDAIWMHSLSHREKDPVKIPTPSGLGPRHLVFHEKRVYVLCELIPTLLVYDYDSRTGKLSLIQEISTVEDKDTSPAQPAAIKIHPSGKTLAVSNRFADTITLFSLDSSTGMAQRAVIFDSRGKICRDMEFSPSGKWLIMAHQDSSDLQLCKFNPQTGLPLNQWGESFESGTPTCLISLD